MAKCPEIILMQIALLMASIIATQRLSDHKTSKPERRIEIVFSFHFPKTEATKFLPISH